MVPIWKAKLGSRIVRVLLLELPLEDLELFLVLLDAHIDAMHQHVSVVFPLKLYQEILILFLFMLHLLIILWKVNEFIKILIWRGGFSVLIFKLLSGLHIWWGDRIIIVIIKMVLLFSLVVKMYATVEETLVVWSSWVGVCLLISIVVCVMVMITGVMVMTGVRMMMMMMMMRI